MKLWKTYTVFTSLLYRIVMFGFLVLFFLIDAVLPIFIHPVAVQSFSFMTVCFVGTIPLYGDMNVFAGLHNRDGGQIGCCQASQRGEKLLLQGVIADRLHVMLWTLCAGVIHYIWGFHTGDATIWSLLTGWGILMGIESIAIYINRFMVTAQGAMLVIMLETIFTSVCCAAFWVLTPKGTWWSALLAVLFSFLSAFGECLIAKFFLKRSYIDE